MRRFVADCDIVHAHNAFPEAIAAVNAFGADMPVVVTLHGSDINYFARKVELRPLIISALNCADAIIAVSSDLEKKVHHMGVKTPVTVIPNGIDSTLFISGPKATAAQQLDLDPDRPRLLFAGNFVPVKGIPYLLRALPAIRQVIPAIELVLLGARSLNDDGGYTKLITELGVETSVTIQERVSHGRLPVWMRAADAFVLPSENEGFGLVLAEALACGRPVIATKCGGPEDIVGDGTGFLVRPREPEALAEAIIRVMQNRGVGDAAYCSAYAHQRFSYETVTSQINNIYNQLTTQRRSDGKYNKGGM